MKICSKCGITKSLNEFSFKTNTKKQSSCKDCHKKYVKKHYLKNKSTYLAHSKINNTINRAKAKSFVNESKNKPCMDCGISYPYWIMDYDHRDADTKINNVAYFAKSSYGLETISKEIEKCDLVCANCHRDRTYKRLKI